MVFFDSLKSSWMTRNRLRLMKIITIEAEQRKRPEEGEAGDTSRQPRREVDAEKSPSQVSGCDDAA